MEKLYNLLKKYKEIKVVRSLQEEQNELFEYVYSTNKLEGNQLSLIQTTELFKSDTISGQNVRGSDILEQKGMYRALKRMLVAIQNDEKLTVALVLELNWLVIGSLWADDYYLDAKSKGQQINEFKASQNVISIKKKNVEIEKIIPLSNPENVAYKMHTLIKTVNESNSSIIDKCAFVAHEIWIHQPFVDGNKRTGRLLINFLLLKEGFPLFSFNDESVNYNSLLVEQYLENKQNLIKDYIVEALTDKMNKAIASFETINKDFKGFRFVL